MRRVDDVERQRQPDERGPKDQELAGRLARGDAAAYEELVRDYGGALLAVARRLLRNEDDARDTVQDAFLSVHRSIGTFTGSSTLSTWLHRIVVNAAISRLRRRMRQPDESIDDLLPAFLPDGHFAETPAAWQLRADLALEREQVRREIRAAIDELPETYRTVLLLRDIEQIDTEEAARVLGVTPNAVKIRLHRAHQALRTLLDRRFRGAGP